MRGASELNRTLPEISIQSSSTRSPVILELKRWLLSAGVVLADDADTKLIVSDIQSEKRTIAYDGRGKAALYELTKSLSISVTQKNGDILLNPTSINARQPYSYSESDTSAKDEEEALLEREMNAALARRIIRRLEKLASNRFAE